MSASTLPTRRSTPWGSIFAIVVAILYGASPVDLIPDIIPLLGFVDDAGVVGILLVIALRLYLRRRRA